MKILTITAFTLFAIFCPARLHARLGERGDEIAKRFGSEVKVHPQYSNASMAIDELGRALYFSMSAETSKIMDILSSWHWERVTFRGYIYGEFSVYVILLDDKSVFEHYRRGAMLSDQEMETLLSANSGDGKWQQRVNPENHGSSIRKWVMVDQATKKPTRMAITNGGNNLAVYSTDLVLYCAEVAQRIVSESDAKRKGTIEGF